MPKLPLKKRLAKQTVSGERDTPTGRVKIASSAWLHFCAKTVADRTHLQHNSPGEPIMQDLTDDPHLDVCENIEAALMQCYRRDAKLTDLLCEFALDNAKIAIKQHFGFAQNERVSQSDAVAPIVAFCSQIGVMRIGKINDLTLKEFVARIDKVKASVRRHSRDGSRAYFEFVSPFLPDADVLLPGAEPK